MSGRPVSETSAVAFQVFVSSSYNVTSLDPVVYDSIIYDTGSGYNTTTGVFTAPVNGTYMFWIQLGIRPLRYYPSTSIRQSGKTIGSGWAAYSSSSEGAVSATCVSHLQKDEEVWVQFEEFRGDIPTPVTVRSGSYVGDPISYFGGVLLTMD
ncbi:collagen alpha-2(VIII) chain-like [Haliotis rubra]|uniref:collagen alpha-2(VIII) chain-like n=1 Tax=Haliotis rubra TaxID=36100 RepID=UPI001EE4F004|nr:collagen alpha-2(VIII) chain-like [Haliotis rubra]